ncbi:MAG: CDP-alcohol phosphatidyltransferase family protein [Gemmatimonadota bacterium]
MFDETFRRALPRFVRGPVRVLVRWGISPNQVTIAAAGVGCAAGVLVAWGAAITGLALWLTSRLLDGVDGILARETGRTSAFGGYLDITFDMLAYGVMLLGFWVRHPEAGWAWPAILLGYVLVTTSTLALSSILEGEHQQSVGGDRTIRFTPGLAEAGETSAAYVLFTLLPGFITPLAWTWAAMCAITVVQRTVLARRLLRSP